MPRRADTDGLLDAAHRARELAWGNTVDWLVKALQAEARIDELLDRRSEEHAAERPGRMA